MFSKPHAFALFHVRAHVRGINPFTTLRRSITFCNLRPDFLAIRGQPCFLLMQNSNSVLHKLVHALLGAALDVLLDQFLDLRPQWDVHSCIIPHDASPPRQSNTTRYTHTNSNSLPHYLSNTYAPPYFCKYRDEPHCVSVSRGTTEAPKGRIMRNLTRSQRSSLSTTLSTPRKTKQANLKYHRLRCEICRHALRQQIEEAFLQWRRPKVLMHCFGIKTETTICHHAHALGLFSFATKA